MRLADVVATLDELYDPAWADPWDRVGLVCGDPDQPVRRILFAVDPAAAVAREAVEGAADLLVVHHPLLLSGVHSVAATSPKGRVVHDLVRNGVALFTAHTNADVPEHGVNDALARCLGLDDLRILLPTDPGAVDKLVAFVPPEHADALRAALAAAGAGRIGDYDGCSFTSLGEGRFRPLPGASPTIGTVGEPEVVGEARVEAVFPRALRREVLAALRAAHPYEEPAYDVLQLATPVPPSRGHGRVGTLPASTSLRDLARRVAAALPRTAHGVRVAGDPERPVRTVAVGAGAGDALLSDVLDSDADVYLTSDLRHHRAAEFLEHGGPALLDVAHWAAEWTWLPVAERRLREALAARAAGSAQRGDTVETHVSVLVTDPWDFRES